MNRHRLAPLVAVARYTVVDLMRSRWRPMIAAMLFATLVAPVLRPFQVVGHLGMVAVLIASAVQLHLFLVREFRHAHV